MFFIDSMIVLFVLLPLSITAGNRIGKAQPLNKFQTNLFVNRDAVEQALGKHYKIVWWAWWVAMIFFSLLSAAYLSALVFGVYLWSRLRFHMLAARPATAVDASA